VLFRSESQGRPIYRVRGIVRGSDS
jgi:hypothetical protein